MKAKHFFPILIFIVFIQGCAEQVKSQYLVGEKPHAVKIEEWAGIWAADCSDDNSDLIRIEVLDKDKGILRLTDVKAGAGSEPIDCYLREAGNWIFANAALKGETDFYPVRVKNLDEGRKIIAWHPDPEKFKSLVFDKKVLPGERHGHDISLGLLKPEHLEIIMSDKQGVLFKWDEPIILIRRGKAPAD
ncbi:MAG TPA: hypothetical protein VEF34_11045 [Syntrophobacteraceae bacterium]|nr:hypothetical protein [Syntrophobacteraceae bacterium]